MECFAAATADACDDACSICLEDFTAQDPATVTTCKHEYHLQCILEWSQRSRECPICWRSLVLSDPLSQELLAAVEVEKNLRTRRRFCHEIPLHTTAIEDLEFRNFHNLVHPDSDESDYDEHMMQELTTASAVGQAYHFGGRERRRSSGLEHSQLLVFRTPSDASDLQQTSFIENQSIRLSTSPEGESLASIICPTVDELPRASPTSSHLGMEFVAANSKQIHLDDRTLAIQTTPPSSPRNLSSFSHSLRSKLSEASSRCKETITRNTRSFKEKLLARNNSVKELGKEVKHEVTTGFVGVARIMERLDITPKKTGNVSPVTDCSEGSSDVTRNDESLQKIHVSVSPDQLVGSDDPVNHQHRPVGNS